MCSMPGARLAGAWGLHSKARVPGICARLCCKAIAAPPASGSPVTETSVIFLKDSLFTMRLPSLS